MNRILIGFGANLTSKDGASPIQTLQHAAEKLTEEGILPIIGSSVWKSAPVPISDQPWYYNAVCLAETKLSAQTVLEAVAHMEERAGRERYIRNEPRVLDLDILTYNDEVIESPNLKIPHPHMHERAFVLYPLKEIVPDWVHPVSKESLEEMILNLDPAQKIECTNEKLIR